MWDFSTEPEFQAKLDWMRDFVREEVRPLELLRLSPEQFDRATAPLKERVKEQQLWAAHLDPELGGQGYGQVKLGLMHEILGTTPFAPMVFGNSAPDSGNSEILALAGTEEQKERWLYPLLNGDLRSAFSMTEPETAGSDPTLLQTRATKDGDGWVLSGHKWFSSHASIADFLIVMAVSDPDARPHQRASMFIVPADAPGVRIARDVATMEHPEDVYGLRAAQSVRRTAGDRRAGPSHARPPPAVRQRPARPRRVQRWPRSRAALRLHSAVRGDARLRREDPRSARRRGRRPCGRRARGAADPMTVAASLPDPGEPMIVPFCAALGAFLGGAVVRAQRVPPDRAAKVVENWVFALTAWGLAAYPRW
jgi:acyl-CoA dehydrogenase